MLPHLGAGAGQCIEDGYLLANLLSLPEVTIDNVEVTVLLACICYDGSLNIFYACRQFSKSTMKCADPERPVSGREASDKARTMSVAARAAHPQMIFART